MSRRVVGSVDSGLEVGAQVVGCRADRRLVDGGHVSVGVVRVDAVCAGVALLARGGRSGRVREDTVVCRRSTVDVGCAVGEHVGGRHQSNRRRDLSAIDGLAVAVRSSATHGNRDVGFGLLATQSESACEGHVACLLRGCWLVSEGRFRKVQYPDQRVCCHEINC